MDRRGRKQREVKPTVSLMLPRWKLLADTRQQKIFDNLNNHPGDAVKSFYFPCAAGPRAAAPRKPEFGLSGRNAAKREQKNLCRA